MLAEERPPSPDLAIFGPHGNRLQRKLIMSGLIPTGLGAFRRIELKGPPDIATWTAAFMVFRALAIMINLAGVNSLNKYIKDIWQLLKDYGTAVWRLLYQAEARMRNGQMPDMQRGLIKDKEEVEKGGGKHPCDPKRPWALVWKWRWTRAQQTVGRMSSLHPQPWFDFA